MKSICVCAALALLGWQVPTESAIEVTRIVPEKVDLGGLTVSVPPTDHKVDAGDVFTNGDGVCVNNYADSSGDACIDPKSGGASSSTEVVAMSGFEGEILGIDANDSVLIKSNSDASVTGSGGEITIMGGSEVAVTNAQGGGHMSISLPGGVSAVVAPGATVTFNTGLD